MVYNILMDTTFYNDFFSPEEIAQIKAVVDHELATRVQVNNEDFTFIDTNNIVEQNYLGRIVMQGVPLPNNIIAKVKELLPDVWKFDVSPDLVGITYNQWSNKYGEPKLSSHIDKNTLGLIFDYQLESNTQWTLGVAETPYPMEDNDMICLYPTRDYHWRAEKKFNDGEYVSLLFFEFAGVGLEPQLDPVREKAAQVARDKASQL